MSSPLPEIVVVAGIIPDGHDRLCLSRRPEHKHQGGLWEFPGGKVEPGEALDHALARELHEELGLDAVRSRPFLTVRHRYPDLRVTLHFREVTAFTGEPHGREGQPVEWVPRTELSARAFPEANRPVAVALQLPPEWVIPPEDLDEATVIAGLGRLDAARQGVYLRGWSTHPGVTAACRERGLRFWVRNDAALATREGAFGLHLNGPALARAAEEGRPAFDGLLSVACHDATQIAQAMAVGADMATLSPVRATPTHPDASPLGWQDFQELVAGNPLVFYALGGVGPEDLATAREHGAYGVAGIRGLWPGV
ncbi:Nudix family hydrolase [Alloalcanivorax gelatiniphagus]|uniref:8-oxo-dGTP diphosphatase n=1 Tax=Alloalcanivorax gelatiniphagus TaxID=1194167 RepID=A0ABY2XFY3_9GAMM|nr:Nudix family hydrolase [Alloalcanivorax gelatiniphagus]TMW10504.1 Nudix family hydrolase [Alloalcanivorax gelatiniphagus]|tara:strand:+ start:39 stop:968 length:930 start_codon:yes stop_codon:yes gene_type:complete